MGDIWLDLRDQFPATKRYAYLNAAAASPIPRPVRESVERFLRQLEADGDRHWDDWLARRDAIRASVARFIGAGADEIAFVPNTSAGINVAVDLLQGDGDVISDALEFPTVTLPWIHRGVNVHVVQPRDGILDVTDFDDTKTPPAAVVLISHVQFSNGCRQDLTSFGSRKGTRHLVVSASQSAGAFPIDVHTSRVDVLAAAGHKWMCAGYGAGFVYVSRNLLQRRPRSMGWLSVEDPFRFDNRRYRLLPSAQRYELGCPSFGPIFALGAAVDLLTSVGVDAIAGRVIALNTYLTDRLTRAGFLVLSPDGVHRSGETLCAVANPAEVTGFLEAHDVLVTTKPEGIRISTHFYNTEQDVDRCVDALMAGVPLSDRRLPVVSRSAS